MSAKNFFTPFKVGLLVIVGVAASLFMLTKLTTSGSPAGGEEGSIRVYALFADVTGLAEQSRVRTAGIAVGEIEKISLTQGGLARVDILVRKDLNLMTGTPPATPGGVWQGGASVAKRSASLIGDFFLEVTPGVTGQPIQDGGQIHNIEGGASMEDLFKTLDKITKDIEQVTGSLAAVFGGEKGQRGMEQILRDLQTILAEVSAFVIGGTEKLDDILSDGQVISANVRQLSNDGAESINDILYDAKIVASDAKVVVRNVRDLVGKSSDDVQAGIGSLSGTLLRLQSTLDSLNYSLQNVQDITDKVNEGEGTIGKLVNDPGIAEKTDAILGDTQEITSVIGRLRTIVQLRSEYHLDAEEFKSVVGLRLQPRRNKYYLVEIVDDFRGVTSVETETFIREDADGRAQTSDRITRVKQTDTFRVSVQFAQGLDVTSWLALTGRFGLIESTGGVGFDLEFFRDRSFKIQTDLFDFDFDRNPRLRTFASYNVAPYIYIMAGLDDYLNDEKPDIDYPGFNPFVAFGIQFTDEDLKGLISVTGAPTN